MCQTLSWIWKRQSTALIVEFITFFLDSIDVTPDGMKAIVTLASGDMRRSLNVLQVSPINVFMQEALLAGEFY